MGFMIIDAHVHLPLNVKDFSAVELAEKLLEWMNGEGLDKVVLLPIAPYHSNDLIAKIVDYEPGRIIGFASVVPNPCDRAVKELRRAIEDLGLKGLKLHPSLQGFCISHPHVWRVLEEAGDLDVPVVLHVMLGDLSTLYFKGEPAPWINKFEDYALLPYVAPKTTMIFAHMGGMFHFEDVISIATFENVYLDTSYSLVTITEKLGLEGFARYVEALGSDKFIFGSDYVMGLTPDRLGARRQIEIIKKLPISEEDKEKILWKNIHKLLNL